MASSTRTSSQGQENPQNLTKGQWNENVVEPELEFDETGLELESRDAFSDLTMGVNMDMDQMDLNEKITLDADHDFGSLNDLSDPGAGTAPVGATTNMSDGTDELAKEEAESGHPFRSGAITPEGLIDEDFEEELGSPSQEDDHDPMSEYRDISKYGIIQVAGDDSYGRKVIVFSACRLPPSKDLDHQRLLVYLKKTLDQYVENDYTLVYFHHGLTSKNKPSFAWMRQAYKEFDRKYKKNLKALYLVHPTNFIKILWNIFKPIISAKFGRKIMYVNYLHELAQYVPLDQLNIPQRVRDHDILLLEQLQAKGKLPHDVFQLAKNKPQPAPTSIVHAPLPNQQFGVTLQYIKEHNNNEVIPPVVSKTIEYICQNGIETEGIFRRSANANILKSVQKSFNEGQVPDFAALSDIHIPAAILKSFLRQLPEPIMTYDLYDHLVKVQTMEEEDKKLEEMRRILHDELPSDNYQVLKMVVLFLTEVTNHSDKNLMNSTNLAIVFGPNLMWSKSQASLTSLAQVNSCAKFLIDNAHLLFNE